MVTHATARYDSNHTSEKGLERLLVTAQEKSISILNLVGPSDDPAGYFFPSRISPTAMLASGGVEIDLEKLKLPVHRLVVAGGYFERCQFHTVAHVLTLFARVWAGHPSEAKDLRVTHYADAVYTLGDFVNRGGIGPSPFPQPDLSKYIDQNGITRTLREALEKQTDIINLMGYYKYVVQEWVEVMENHQVPHSPETAFVSTYNINIEHDGKFFETFKKAAHQPAPTLTFNLVTSRIEDIGSSVVFGE